MHESYRYKFLLSANLALIRVDYMGPTLYNTPKSSLIK